MQFCAVPEADAGTDAGTAYCLSLLHHFPACLVAFAVWQLVPLKPAVQLQAQLPELTMPVAVPLF
jgi:hypothetical protein